MAGWIKLQRDIMEHWVAQDCEYLSVWIRMLSEANFENRTGMFNGQIVKITRGQLVFGLDSYSEKTKVSVMRLRRLIKLLEDDGMINRVVKAKYSIITILNYDKHQHDNRQETSTEQAENKQATGTEQAQNSTIRIKEVKELKKRDVSADAFDFSSWPSMPSNQLMADWIKVRKAKRAAITQTAINSIGKELHKAAALGYTVDDALSAAVSSGWQGFKADWLSNSSRVKQGFEVNQAKNAIGDFLND